MTSSAGSPGGSEIMNASKAPSTVPDVNISYWKPMMEQFLRKLSSNQLVVEHMGSWNMVSESFYSGSCMIV